MKQRAWVGIQLLILLYSATLTSAWGKGKVRALLGDTTGYDYEVACIKERLTQFWTSDDPAHLGRTIVDISLSPSRYGPPKDDIGVRAWNSRKALRTLRSEFLDELKSRKKTDPSSLVEMKIPKPYQESAREMLLKMRKDLEEISELSDDHIKNILSYYRATREPPSVDQVRRMLSKSLDGIKNCQRQKMISYKDLISSSSDYWDMMQLKSVNKMTSNSTSADNNQIFSFYFDPKAKANLIKTTEKNLRRDIPIFFIPSFAGMSQRRSTEAFAHYVHPLWLTDKMRHFDGYRYSNSRGTAIHDLAHSDEVFGELKNSSRPVEPLDPKQKRWMDNVFDSIDEIEPKQQKVLVDTLLYVIIHEHGKLPIQKDLLRLLGSKNRERELKAIFDDLRANVRGGVFDPETCSILKGYATRGQMNKAAEQLRAILATGG